MKFLGFACLAVLLGVSSLEGEEPYGEIQINYSSDGECSAYEKEVLVTWASLLGDGGGLLWGPTVSTTTMEPASTLPPAMERFANAYFTAKRIVLGITSKLIVMLVKGQIASLAHSATPPSHAIMHD
ncbi:hypothetical protein V8E54_004171 [Elaphomyces granulatus]